MEPLTDEERARLTEVFTTKLGTKADYNAWSNGMALLPFLRKQVGISNEALDLRFGSFLNSETLNDQQLEYMRQVIAYARENGDATSTDLLSESPFRDVNLSTFFGQDKMAYLKQLINGLDRPVFDKSVSE